MARLLTLLRSDWFFYTVLGIFGLSAAWVAVASLYPMAFDEEFHYGLLQIYATSWLPYGIAHTSDMAQFGAATADASYLFHYLMSFPYRLLTAFSLPDTAIIVMLRMINIGFVIGALLVFRKAFLEARLGRATAHIALALVTSIPVFVTLAAHINYDNLLLLVVAWCTLLLVRISADAYAGKAISFKDITLLAIAVLIGMSVKYAFLPLALAMFAWLIWLLIVMYRKHRQTVTSQYTMLLRDWRRMPSRSRKLYVTLGLISIFFASHYVTNAVSYGSPIPTCEQVFSATECTAYGPWERNEYLVATKPSDFSPVPFPLYLADEWFPGMTIRLTFAVAGKTNDFQTKQPLPALVYLYVSLALIGLVALVIQAARKRTSWFAGMTVLCTLVYAGVLAFKLYGSYVLTAEPVAINGRYLIPLLPLVAAAMIVAIRQLLSGIQSRFIAVATLLLVACLTVSGGGILTYVVLAEPHWFWSGFGQSSHAILQGIANNLVLP